MTSEGKWQWIRLVDVFFLGPFMIWYAFHTRNIMAIEHVAILMFFGITTILVNAYFYVKLLPKTI